MIKNIVNNFILGMCLLSSYNSYTLTKKEIFSICIKSISFPTLIFYWDILCLDYYKSKIQPLSPLEQFSSSAARFSIVSFNLLSILANLHTELQKEAKEKKLESSKTNDVKLVDDVEVKIIS